MIPVVSTITHAIECADLRKGGSGTRDPGLVMLIAATFRWSFFAYSHSVM